MAVNEIFKLGQALSLPVPADTPAGSPVRIGILNAWTETPEGAGVGNIEGYASVNRTGAFKADVTGALTKGQAVYIKSDRTLTATATGNFLFGASLSEKGTGTGSAVVVVLQPGQTTASA